MPIETYLIRMSDPPRKNSITKVLNTLKNLGDDINAVIKDGSVIICTMESSHADLVRGLPGVRLVGGVQINRRRIRKTKKRIR